MRFLRKLFPRDELTFSEISTTEDVAEGDARVISMLAEQGADLSQPLQVRHYLYFRDRAAASAVTERLQAEGFSIEQDHSRKYGWSVRASHATPVNAERIASLRARLTQVASSLDGEYDGWEAALPA